MTTAEPDSSVSKGILWAEMVAVFAAWLALFLGLTRGLGVTWDESIYFKFADTVAEWFRNGADLSQDAVARAWDFDPFLNTHPELFRILDAIGAAMFSRWLAFPLNYRLAHLVYMALCFALVYRLIRSKTTRVFALAAIAFATLIPRALGDLLLANSDSPVMASWFAGVVVAWRLDGEGDSRRRWILRGLLVAICAIAGAGKVTGVLMLPPLFIYFLVRRNQKELPTVILGAMGALILPILVSPEKWANPIDAAVAYITYPWARAGIPIASTYLGHAYTTDLPWHYFFIMSLVTVPVPVWLCLPGVAICPKPWRSLAIALSLSIGMWVLVGLWPGTPRHDGVRQFVSVYPLLALLAWIGSMGYLKRLSDERPAISRAALGSLSLAVPILLVGTVTLCHPHELSYYNSLIGGIRGAEKLGMEITYYFDALNDAPLTAIEQNVRPGQTLALSPFWPQLLRSYSDHNARHFDFKIVQAGAPADWLLLYRRRHNVDDRVYLELPAVHEVLYDGVSLLKLVRVSDLPKALVYPSSPQN